MKLQFFNTLDAVLRGGSLAAAAQEMNLTPSAVSMQMKQMEEYFGQAMFDRSSLQVRPTAFALELNRSLRDVVNSVEGMRRRPTPMVQGRFRLGVIETMQSSLLPDAMRSVRQRYPLLEVMPIRGRSVELLDGLKAGKMDAAIVAQPKDGGSSRLHWQQLMRKDLVLVTPPEAKEASVDQLLSNYDLIGFDKSTIGGKLATRFLTERGHTRNPVMELQSTHAVVAMVSAGLGVSIILKPDARICKGYPVRIEPLGDNPPSMYIAIACRNADADNRLFLAIEAAFQHATQAAKYPRRKRSEQSWR